MANSIESPKSLPLNLKPFALERFFAKYEFNVKHLLCCSDSEALTIAELLEFASDADRQNFQNLSLGYTESPGNPELRKLISQKHYTTISEENILIGAPQELIFLIMHALLNPGDKVICISPGYQSLYEIPRALGADIIFLKHEFDQNTLENLMKQEKNVKLVIVNFPHNPTGHIPDPSTWKALSNICQKSTHPGGAYLFSDEMYRGLEFDDQSISLAAGVDVMPPGRGISLCGLSKSVGFPGLRIGWLACSDKELLAKAAALKDYTTICPPAPSEQLAIIAVKAWDQIIDRQMLILKQNLDSLVDVYAKKWRNLMEISRPKGGTMCYPRINLPPASSYSSLDQFCKILAEEHGVLLLPSTVYGDSEEPRVRIGFGRRNFVEGLKALDEAFTKMGVVD